MSKTKNIPVSRFLTRLQGSIQDENTLEFLQLLDEAMKLQPKRAKRVIRIIINSKGGDCDCGFAIYDALKRSGLEIETVVEGSAASMGAIVFMAGKVRMITPNSTIAVHRPKISQIQEKSGLEDYGLTVSWLKSMESRMLNIVLCEIEEKYKAKVARDIRLGKFYSAEEAIKYGFAHKII